MKNRLKDIRWEQRLTQEALAAKAGMSRTSLTQIENGKVDPDGNTIAKLVSALRIPANKIFCDLDVPEKSSRKSRSGITENPTA